jgi:hypothetical protein
MPSCFDIYVLSEKRSPREIGNFLNSFLPDHEEMASEYEYPQYSDTPSHMYESADEIIRICSEDQSKEYGLYWTNKGNSPLFGMIFFMQDGSVIYGLSNNDEYPMIAKELFEKMKLHLGSNLGYIGHEASPDAKNRMEFLEQIEIHRDII